METLRGWLRTVYNSECSLKEVHNNSTMRITSVVMLLVIIVH